MSPTTSTTGATPQHLKGKGTNPVNKVKIAVVSFMITIAALFALYQAAPGHADEYFINCPSGLTAVATEDTSCAFADNVRRAYYGQPGSTVIAYSPVTGLFYTMQCRSAWTTNGWYNPERCFGVNAFGAVLIVYIA